MKPINSKPMFNKKEEKRNKILMFVFAIIFFSLAYITQGQTMKIARWGAASPSSTVITKVPSYPLMFRPLSTKDTIYLSAVADSVGNNVYAIALYCYVSEGVKLTDGGVKIWYKDLSVDEFVLQEHNKIDNSAKYNIVGNSLSNLFHKEMFAVEVKGLVYCESIANKKYFMEFFSKYDK